MKTFRIQFVATSLLLFTLTTISVHSQNKMQNSFSKADIQFDKDGISPVEIRFGEGVTVTKGNFFSQYKSFFGLSEAYEFVQVQELNDKLGQTHYRFTQFYKGIEVINAQLILHEKNGIIHYANGRTVHGIKLDISPSISEQTALQSALNNINAEIYKWEIPGNEIFIKNEQQDPNATYYPSGVLKITSDSIDKKGTDMKLVYRFDIYAEQPLSRNFVDVDAATGEIVNVISRIYENDVPSTGNALYNGTVSMNVDSFPGGYRLQEIGRGSGIKTYDMQNGYNYNNAIDFVDNDNSFTDPNDQAGVSVHWAAEETYDYYLKTFDRKSFDNSSGTILGYAHRGVDYNNAFWNGTSMTFGDGDGVIYSPLVSVDAVAHEFTHGVTQYSAGLIYSYESGALNESFSDIFGTAVEFYLEGADSADWLIGEDFTLQYPFCLRSMENPNLADKPDTYRGTYWYYGPGDHGGVHTNSSVQNSWFYLLAVGGTGVNDNGDPYSVPGIGIDDAIEIAYRNLTVYLTPTSNYLQARQGSINSTADLFGMGSQQYLSVIDAWNAVGVNAVLADFVASETGGQPPLTVQFTDLSTSSPGTITLWQWDFNDDGIIDATEQNPSWTYTETGMYTVSLTVSDGTNTNSFTKTEYIVLFNSGDILVWEGVPDGANYSGIFIRDFLLSKNLDVIYLTSREIPFPLTGLEAVFLSFGNYGHNGSTCTPFTEWNAEAIKAYLQESESKVYLEGGDALGFDQAGNYGLLNLLGISNAQDGTLENTPVTNLVGQTGTITEGMLFTSSSQPNNTFIDIYTPNAWGKISFIDTTVNADTTLGNVAVQNAGVYGQKSFCFSYALAKLNDGSFPNTKVELLTKILDFFDIPVTEVAVDVDIPLIFSLEQNYPNPFNPSTKITYSVAQKSQVLIKVYDVLGNEIETLVDGEKPTGEYEINWNAANLPSGVYFYQLKAGRFIETKKMVLLK